MSDLKKNIRQGLANNNLPLKEQIDAVVQQELIVKAEKQILLKKAWESNDPAAIVKANTVLANIEERQRSDRKSIILDPNDYGGMGYKEKPIAMSYGTLERMSKTPIINAVIKTRVNQIASFCVPRENRNGVGFVIRKKGKLDGIQDKDATDVEKKKIELMTDFIMNCGQFHSWEADDFDTFTRKVIRDSLVYDQATFEVVRTRAGYPYELFATDASTIRIADSYDDDRYNNGTLRGQSNNRVNAQKVNGYYPSYVQVHQGQVLAEFYPWELCLGVRNPTSSIYSNGYGVSELEELITVVTSMIWGDQYNRNFFSQGSAPKGILKIKGQINQQELKQFKQAWQAMVQGVENSWKTPILDGGTEVDWIDLQRSNRDMEWGKWVEYLIKLGCAIYQIDPSEINFNMSGSGEQKPMFEGNNEARLKHSKDKGLMPLLMFWQRRINKYVIETIDPDYEFVFVGVDAMTLADEVDLAVKTGGAFKTINEIRKEFGLDKVENGDIIANGFFMQAWQAKQQQEQAEQQQQMQGGSDDDGGQFGGDAEGEDGDHDQEEEDSSQYFDQEKYNPDKNPIAKAFMGFMEKELVE